ncbi:MAG: hypothetical protein J7M40_12820 [Planctomycetes bacterium]|nr:hypothetical protein [Planctomycetota bacterium]
MSSKDYRIEPPSGDNGPEPLFRVVYVIDVNASGKRKAAEIAWQMMRAEDAFAPVLVVLDSKGKQATFDLSDCLEFDKVTTGFVVQKYRKGRRGKFKCVHQKFIAGDDVQFENNKGQPVEPPQHEYQPFNMLLISTQEIIDRLGDVLTGIDVGGEQSRQFANEIRILERLLGKLGWQ